MTCMLISAITTAYLEWKGEGEGEWKRVRAGQLTIYISYRIMQPRIVSPRPLFCYADNLNTWNICKCTHLWTGACDQTVGFLPTMEKPRSSNYKSLADNLSKLNICMCTHLWRGSCDRTAELGPLLMGPGSSLGCPGFLQTKCDDTSLVSAPENATTNIDNGLFKPI